MSYLKKYQWELVPEKLPLVKRKCPKCNEKTHYINSEKFRINANKNNIDVWLIYQCEKCKSTWNMTIYERVKPYDIDKNEYEKLLSNDKELVRKYAFNIGMYNKNKAEFILQDGNYKVIEKELEAYCIKEDEFHVEILCDYPIEVRIDKLLSDRFSISRSKIKSMYKEGIIIIDTEKNSLNTKIKSGMEICILKWMENAELLESESIV